MDSEASEVEKKTPLVREDARELCPEKRKVENDGLYGEGGNLRGAATGVVERAKSKGFVGESVSSPSTPL